MIRRSRVLSAAVRGTDAEPVFVEVQVGPGLPNISILGLPDSAVRESRDRVKAAIQSSGFDFPSGKVLVNLAPAHTRKEGPWFDLPIALAILAASGSIPFGDLTSVLFIGELALDGTLRPVRGALAVARAAKRCGVRRLIVAEGSAPAAALVEGLEVLPVADLRTTAQVLAGTVHVEAYARERALAGLASPEEEEPLLLEEVVGQAIAKRALTIAAAGGHNLLLVGPPGAGKSMLARRLPSLLPPPTLEEALEIAAVRDLVRPGAELRARRPFRAPHHSTSRAGLIGGGMELRPGEVTLSHGGVLFLDEFPEFPRDALEALRQPLEEGSVSLARATGVTTFPAAFQLVAAMNPCPCGWSGHPIRPCKCLPRDHARYRAQLSGPLLDRIDLSVTVAAITPNDLKESARASSGPTTEESRRAIARARAAQLARQGARANARLLPRELPQSCALDAQSRSLLDRALERLGLTMRAYGRVLRVARTVADLEGARGIRAEHVTEALTFRLGTESR